MYRTPLILTILLLSLVCPSSAQNLVKNPSFEEHNKCPEELGNIDEDVPHWSRASNGTTDYFNSCSTAMGMPKNFNGYQEAEFGEAYAGLYLSAPNNYREYLQGELEQPLKKGSKYQVSFYVSLADKSNFALRDIGVLFSPNRSKEDTRKVIKYFSNLRGNGRSSFVEVRNWMYFGNKSGWTQVSTTITAKGNEKYMTIGNFRDDTKSHMNRVKGVKSAAYYYLDMVSVTLLPEEYPHNDLQINKMYVLEHVVFPSDVYELNENAKKELDRLFVELGKDASLYVTIHAHTDNAGSSDYNRELSSKRAKSVARYLLGKGLPKERIRWVGHGGDQPVAENTSEDGKQKNRRAEFMISNGAFESHSDRITETIFEDDNE